MIVDSHVYCFTAPDTAAGHPSSAAHMAFWQRQYGLHHQPAFRVRDRAPGDSHQLLDPAPGDPLRLAANRNFRVDRQTNRLVWTIDGEDYTKQQLPPNVIEFPPGAIIAEMDHAGVDWGLIHTDATLGKDVAYLRACVDAFPNRLKSMAPVDEWLIPTQPEVAIRQAVDAVKQHRMHVLKVIPEYAYRNTASRSFAEPSWDPFWEAVAKLGVPVFFTLGESPGSTDPRQGFINELWTLRRWHERHPHVPVSVTHGYPWRAFLNGRSFEMPAGMWAPLTGSRIHLEVGFPFRIGDLFEYPFRECLPVLAAMVEHVGPDLLIWGSDMPFQNRFCTYRQSRDYIEKHTQSFLSAADLAKVMGGNAARILGITPERALS